MSGSIANSHRKYNPDPLMPVALRLPESVIKQLDSVRGEQSRNGFITDAVKTALYYEAKG